METIASGIKVDISEDELTAYITFHLPEEDLLPEKRQSLFLSCIQALSKENVQFGIKSDFLKGEIVSGRTYIAAEGVRPVNGTDAAVTLYTIEESRPELQDDGSVNHYELKLINRVKAGDWLGERIEPVEGIPGTSVTGKAIKPVPGRTLNLNYDRYSVRENYEGSKTVLYSRVNGAVNFDQGKIAVSEHLEINGDVDLSTGNINFDGFVTIKGTVTDGFSVIAAKDIEIEGQLGLGNVREISSTGGSVYVRGGICSKGKSEIRAARNVFLKFADNTLIESGEATHIGYYCINSTVKAREVIMDSVNGKIMGGSIRAEVRVSSPIIGSEIEKKTTVEVTGFSRMAMLQQLEDVFRHISETKKQLHMLLQLQNSLDPSAKASPYIRRQHLDTVEGIFQYRETIKSLEEERKNLVRYLKAKGDGEITAAKIIYPNCILVLKGMRVDINNVIKQATYYIQDGMIKQA